MNIPWDDCKVAFGINDAEPFDNYRGTGDILDLPPGWEIDEIDGTGARYVVVFRVAKLPTIKDGKEVLRQLKEIGAIH